MEKFKNEFKILDKIKTLKPFSEKLDKNLKTLFISIRKKK